MLAQAQEIEVGGKVLEKAAAARAASNKVWWYICCSPHPPYANMFIESPAIEARLLVGAMTAKIRPDGFLYYQTSIWNSENPIVKAPFTEWEARSYRNYHGDGSWTCLGPDGLPLPTQRLENFRDGLEDFAYVRMLEKLTVDLNQTSSADWLTAARQVLLVPENLVKDMRSYTHDSQILYQWRNQIAELIESAPTP